MDATRRCRTAALALGALLLAGCASAPGMRGKFIPRPDGRYDNHAYMVDPERMNFSQVASSIVRLVTRTTFEGPNGEIIQKNLEGSGVALAERFVLTVEHSVAQNSVEIPTPLGIVKLPLKKREDKTSIRWNGAEYPLRPLYKNHEEDIALFELPPHVRPPAFPYPLGNSDQLKVGNFIYIIGNPLNLGINVREGIVSALRAPKEVKRIEANGDNAFMVSNGLIPGDSGTPVVAIRDGRFELVGLAQGTFIGNSRLGWVIRINVILDKLRRAKALPDKRWAAPPRPLPVAAVRTVPGRILAWPTLGPEASPAP